MMQDCATEEFRGKFNVAGVAYARDSAAKSEMSADCGP